MVIVETHVFTKLICDLLSDEQSRRLQLALMLRPEQGVLVPGGSGLRKLRWRNPVAANVADCVSSTTGTRNATGST